MTIKLHYKTILEIFPTAPFLFDATFFKPGHFPTQDKQWRPGERRQTMLFGGKRLGIIFKDSGISVKPKIICKIYSEEKLRPDFLVNLKSEIIWRYNLNLDLSSFYRSIRKEKALKNTVKRFYGMRPMHPGSLYEYLIIAIVLQNATVRRSVTMMQNLFENYGVLLKFAGKSFWSFWEPNKLATAQEKKLRDLKMGYRAKSLLRISLSFTRWEIDETRLRKKSCAEQEETLLSLYGIGPASTSYIMFDVFHRWDYLKHISPWEQKIYTKIFFNKDYEKKLIPVKTMLAHFERWGIWKNLAVHYVWEDLWWKRRNKHIPWLEKLIRL